MMDISIRELSREEYQDYPFTVRYVTDRYYDVVLLEEGFRLELKSFSEPVEKGFSDTLFSDWLESPVVFGAFVDGRLAGFVEGSGEVWHNLFRISNVFVREEFRGKGVATHVMLHMIDHARKQPKWRGVVLETQTCNYPAICLYKKLGFRLTRIDLNEYTNDDVARKEARIDLILKF